MNELLPIIVFGTGIYFFFTRFLKDKVKTSNNNVESYKEEMSVISSVLKKLKDEVLDNSFLSSLSGSRTKIIGLTLAALALNNYLQIIDPKFVNTLLIAGVGLGLYYFRIALDNMEKRLVALFSEVKKDEAPREDKISVPTQE
jgi:uncharacterized protein YacL